MKDFEEKLIKTMMAFLLVVFVPCMGILIYAVITDDAPVIVKLFFCSVFVVMAAFVTVMIICFFKETKE